MVMGVVQMKQILFHPILAIHVIGLAGFLKLLVRVIHHRKCCFADFIHL